MARTAVELVQAFAEAFSLSDARALAPFLGEEITARFEEAGRLDGRRTVLDFWRRLFQVYPHVHLQISRFVADGGLVIAEVLYALSPSAERTTSVRTISVFEVEDDVIVRWADHADLTDVPIQERALWRRLGAARW